MVKKTQRINGKNPKFLAFSHPDWFLPYTFFSHRHRHLSFIKCHLLISTQLYAVARSLGLISVDIFFLKKLLFYSNISFLWSVEDVSKSSLKPCPRHLGIQRLQIQLSAPGGGADSHRPHHRTIFLNILIVIKTIITFPFHITFFIEFMAIWIARE